LAVRICRKNPLLELRTEAGAASIVEKQEQIECRVASLQWSPIGRLDAITTLVNHHVFFLDEGYIGTMTSFCRYHHVHWGSGCWRLLGRKQGDGSDKRD
jgi:hypothetical protein